MASYGYSNLFEESVSAVTATPSVDLGTRRHYNGVDYVYCYNAADTVASPGWGMINSFNSGYSVVVSSVTGDHCFGVVVNATATTNSYFWLAQRGYVKIEIGDTVIGNHSATVGRPFALMSLGKFYGVTSGATGNTWAYTRAGVTCETIATNASGRAYINVL